MFQACLGIGSGEVECGEVWCGVVGGTVLLYKGQLYPGLGDTLFKPF